MFNQRKAELDAEPFPKTISDLDRQLRAGYRFRPKQIIEIRNSISLLQAGHAAQFAAEHGLPDRMADWDSAELIKCLGFDPLAE